MNSPASCRQVLPTQDHSDLPWYCEQDNETDLFERAWRSQLPLLIKGPTGCGKTRLVTHMAARLGRPLYTIACHDDLSATDLIGRHLISDTGTYWCDGPLTRAVRDGAICYLDEVVEARKDTTVVLHPLSDDRRILPIERNGETLQAPPEFMLVVSYNPGYQNLLKGIKPSTRQRFIGLTLDYPDTGTEQQIVVQESGIEASVARQLVELGQALRNLKDHDLEEAPSTRLLVYAAKLCNTGLSLKQACYAAIVEALTDEPETLIALKDLVDVCCDDA